MFLYNLAILLYSFIIKAASLRKIKAKQWVNGRKNWRLQLSQKIKHLPNAKTIWVHCASYGEFEQGRPLIESIKKNYPKYNIVLSFFSPSGYEVFKNWKGADIICYLPLDTPKNARDFLNMVNPCLSIFIKYEFWVNFLNTLNKKNIPSYLVSAVFKAHHPFFKWYGGIFKKSLSTFSKLFIQDEKSGELLKKIQILNYEVCGDTRFDRVIEISKNFKPLPFFENFCTGSPVLVAGSTYFADEELIINAFKQLNNPYFKLIIVPHNVENASIQRLKAFLTDNQISYTAYSQQQINSNSRVLIVDTIGLLNNIYFYATVTYVGGGFNSGIHNTLEPAVYLKPVIFSDLKHAKFNEVVDLINIHAAKNISSVAELTETLEFYLSTNGLTHTVKKNLETYFEKNSGSTKKIIENLNLV